MIALTEIAQFCSSKLLTAWLRPLSSRARFLTREEDVEIHALRKRGWSISAIARHTGRNRRTIRNYLNGVTTPGMRKPTGADPFEAFVDYVSARLREDPHLWARTLLDKLEELGFTVSYPTLTRNIRERGLRPDCAACRTATDGPNAIIEHEPGDETQWDWLDLPSAGVVGVGSHRASAGRVTGAIRLVARCVVAVDPSAAPSRWPGPGGPGPGWGDAVVAVRPDVQALLSCGGGDHRFLRRGGQVLRGFGEHLPRRARQP